MQPDQARFRNMADNVPMMIWVTDKEGFCTYLNKRWLEFTGQTLEEGQGLGWSNALHPGDRDSTVQQFLEASRNQQPFEKEYKLRKWDGSYEWVLDSSVPYFDPQGNFLGYIGSVSNINHRKLAERTLLETSKRLEIATTAAQVGIWTLHVRSNKLEWSPLHNKMWGYNKQRNNLTYADWHKVILPDDKAKAFGEVINALRKQIQFDATYRIKRVNDGEIRWMRSFGQYLYNKNGEPETFTGVTIDITEQKIAEESIRESEERFRTLAETLPQLVWMSDEKGRQLFVSSRWEEYTGIKPITTDNWGSYVHPDDQKAMIDTWKHSLQTGLSYKQETRLKNKTGEYRWHHLQGEPVRNERGAITRWIGSLTDIHDQKTLSQRLEEQVRKRTKELQRSNQDLQQFAHIASHDLKEPLRKTKTFIDRLQKELGEHLNENARLYISRIVNAVNRMGVMIDGVLSYATTSALEEMFKKVNLNEVIKSVEVDLELIIHQKGATIHYDNLPTIEGAPVILHQLFYNLVNNALKFARPDVPPVITITSKMENQDGQEYALVTVQDNGIGFEQEYADQIFDTFIRLNSKDQYEGSGLGLALCKNIVERHGGSIKAKGSPNQGASFQISLPIKR